MIGAHYIICHGPKEAPAHETADVRKEAPAHETVTVRKEAPAHEAIAVGKEAPVHEAVTVGKEAPAHEAVAVGKDSGPQAREKKEGRSSYSIHGADVFGDEGWDGAGRDAGGGGAGRKRKRRNPFERAVLLLF